MLKYLTIAVALGGTAFVYSASTAPQACAAGLGCCMERANTGKAPWIQRAEKTTLAQCKKLNAKDNNGQGDKILKPLGRVMWSIKC